MSEDVKIAKDSIEDSTVEGVRSLEADKYKYGFDSDIKQEFAPKGLNEDIVRFISAKKDEPQWLLDWRLMGDGRLSENRFSGHVLLCLAGEKEGTELA